MQRREFFKRSGRWLLTGGLAASAGFLVAKNKITAGSCEVAAGCRDCAKLAKCNEKQANRYKKI